MELKDNAGVIRIPVADPSAGKSGLLKFALPRECVTCAEEPAFYATSDTFVAAAPSACASEATTTRSSTASGDVATFLDLALDSLRDARTGLGDMQQDFEYAGFTVQRAQTDFSRLEGPLSTAVSDTPSRNVSAAGEQLDFQLWGARNSLKDCETGAVRTAGDAQSVGRSLEAAAEHLEAMRDAMPMVDTGVIALLEEAQSAVASAVENNELVRGAVGPCVFDLRSAEGGLLFSEQHVADIKSDRMGVDVSASARSLRSAINDINASLSRTDSALDSASEHATPADESAERAEVALESLRERLSRG